MPVLLFKILLTLLLVSCFGSFAWAVRNFFVKSERLTTGVRLTLLTGTAFAILHLLVIFFSSTLSTLAVAGAAALYILSLVVFWWAIAANRVKPLAACFAHNEQLHLVQHGPYRFVRHPFYCSYLLAWVAGAVGTLSIWLAFTAVVMFILYRTAAVNEENKFAHSPLASAYAAYRAATGRFLPKPFKLSSRLL
jgi:protein-S-isoprenylcysteine O-methyltransferase Ste14